LSNPARAKGTQGENFFLEVLRELFYPDYVGLDEDHPLQRLDQAARHKRAVDGDYVGVPWTHEAKNTKRPLFLEWARHLRKKVGDDWVLLWKGDLRKKEGPYVLMPLSKYQELVEAAR